MPANYVLLSEVTVGAAGAASVTMANIPQSGYTDLKVVVSARMSTNVGANWYDLGLTFNGTSSGYSGRWVLGNGSAASSGTDGTSAYIIIRPPSNTATASTFGNCEVYVPNYTSSNHKSVSIDNVSETNATSAIAIMTASLWSNTAAITSMTFTAATGNIDANSTFYLYGLAAVGTTPVIAPFASGGDIVTNDGTYWIHTFLSSGTFTPAKTLTCDYLVVAGGGGGGGSRGSGGGAGGFRTAAAQSLTATGYAVTVGAGGVGGVSSSTSFATQGIDSIFSSTTSAGGGRGKSDGQGGIPGGAGVAGGSGGGGGAAYSSSTSPGGAGNTPSTSPSQGNSGGTGADVASPAGGGGGGAGATGGAASNAQGGSGGNGSANSYSGSSVTYAGGGGGGAYFGTGGAAGTGGGGAGSGTSTGTAGTVNLGGGGGGGGNGQTGGAGGSGIVIIRYPIA
jgi:hypothetical protein